MSASSDQNQEPSNPAASVSNVPTWFWVVSGIALLWNLMGVMMFFAQIMMTEEAMATLPAEQQELYNSAPMWSTIAFAVAVFGGAIGCVGLLMRAKWAFPVFIVSLIGVLAQQAYFFLMSDTVAVMGIGALIPTMIVLVIAILLVMFSKIWIGKGWLK